MTIKKTVKTTRPSVAATSGNGAVADRFRLDAPDPSAKPAAGTATTVAVVAGLIALGVVGILTFVLYKHWEFLMPA